MSHLVWLWSLNQHLTPDTLRDRATVELAERCAEMGVYPRETARLWICRSPGDLVSLCRSTPVAAAELARLAGRVDRWPQLVAVVPVRDLCERKAAA